jgi:hypothetical protein
MECQLHLENKEGRSLRRPISFYSLTLLLTGFLGLAAALPAQQPRPQSFRAEHYDVAASLDSAGQTLSATARVTFIAAEASRIVDAELHPNVTSRVPCCSTSRSRHPWLRAAA